MKKSKKTSSSKSSSLAAAAAPPPSSYTPSVPTFGQYGLIKSSDIHSNAKHQRSFQIWLEQIKGIPMQTSTIPKWELQNYFEEYREDFNTATLPHVKYYNYDEWEVQEYAREQQERNAGNATTGTDVHAEERQHALALQQRAKQKVLEQEAITKALMSKEKVQDMKRRAELQSEMNHAFKRGDTEAYRRLQRRLEPDAK
jgi:hypothetical protein